MGLFNLFNKDDINQSVEEAKATGDAILLDVRTQEEYKDGHIEGSINIPLQAINKVLNDFPTKDVKLYVYCRSGARSGQAVNYLKQLGYTNIKNIGGIIDYKGKLFK